MSRLSALAAKPRIALGALLTMLLAAAAVVGSGADFTAQSAYAIAGGGGCFARSAS